MQHGNVEKTLQQSIKKFSRLFKCTDIESDSTSVFYRLKYHFCMSNVDSYLTRTLRAPNGVTSVAGANAYAAKLATSPAPTEEMNKNTSQTGM